MRRIGFISNKLYEAVEKERRFDHVFKLGLLYIDVAFRVEGFLTFQKLLTVS